MTEPVSTPQVSPGTARSGCLRWFVVTVLLGLLVMGVMSIFFLKTLKETLSMLANLPGQMVHSDIETRFKESITKISATNGDILEVATMETNETVTRYDMKTLFNEIIYLGTTVSEIRTPVVYRYHIKLSEDWQLHVQDGQCIVRAPGLRPSQPPAVRTDGMEKKSDAGWFRFNADDNLANLEKELTPTLEKRAGNKAHLDNIREAARKSVAEFVKKWLLDSARNDDGTSQIRSITVIFPDDAQPNTGPITLPPTIQVQ
ncbi:hypothetical protein [Brevifollis gellanilyticus]|uniref:DUF4230 domain-containing protein n=1 Tax=Brevifollis gellanilyticus TaxID=748831 RepID=A0A512M9N4_9BACT|nr:hypothetical protein [Brevifollis gellanilyticus]GEP43449.1 hypothetical protein BGE01nite_27400 [Brevifollis gellanilyticus]